MHALPTTTAHSSLRPRSAISLCGKTRTSPPKRNYWNLLQSPCHSTSHSHFPDSRQITFSNCIPSIAFTSMIILHHFEGDMTNINKDFHSKFQPLSFTTYQIKSCMACQTSTFSDCVNLQKFLKENKVPFNLLIRSYAIQGSH